MRVLSVMLLLLSACGGRSQSPSAVDGGAASESGLEATSSVDSVRAAVDAGASHDSLRDARSVTLDVAPPALDSRTRPEAPAVALDAALPDARTVGLAGQPCTAAYRCVDGSQCASFGLYGGCSSGWPPPAVCSVAATFPGACGILGATCCTPPLGMSQPYCAGALYCDSFDGTCKERCP